MRNILQSKKVLALIFFSPAFILFFTWLFMQLESWSFIDSMYFTVATITTVGYGDLVPTNQASKITSIILMIFIIPMVLVMLGIISDLITSHFHRITIKKD